MGLHICQIKKLMFVFVALTSVALLISESLFAADSNLLYKALWDKQNQREASHWTLEGWLVQRDRMRLQDLWLAQNSSPYEFYFGASYNPVTITTTIPNGDTKITSTTSGSELDFAAYASFVGLEASWENYPSTNSFSSVSDTTGQLNFRVLGPSIQTTHLILAGGQRTRKQGELPLLRQTFAQAKLTVYLNRYFGIEGDYCNFNPTSAADSDSGSGAGLAGAATNTSAEIRETASSVGLFIDFAFFRVFGNSWRAEVQGGSSPSIRSGTKAGFKIFF